MARFPDAEKRIREHAQKGSTMTNKATVSQPKVVAAKPSEPVIQAMKAILFSGRIVDTFMIYDLYNAAHRVERSQPKSTPQEKIPQESIGDDALSEFIEEYEWRTDAFCHKPTEAERLMLLDFAVNLDDSRAPAAQASATIQAAPEGYALVPLVMNSEMRHVLDEEGWTWEDLLGAAEAITDEQYAMIAADTIQEPVMVAEPVGESFHEKLAREMREGTAVFVSASKPAAPMVAELVDASGLSAAVLQAMYKAFQRGDSVERAHAAVMALVAAPMVADPAGVAVEQWHQSKYKMLEDYIAKLETNLAATVKAIPSEALEAAVKACEQVQARVIESNGGEAHYDDWSTMDEGIYAGAGYCIGKINALQIAAPLADKTGGGE